MPNLPAVDDDFESAMSLVHIMGILPKNIFIFKDPDYDTLKEFYYRLANLLRAKTK